jgi:hypothetical protein
MKSEASSMRLIQRFCPVSRQPPLIAGTSAVVISRICVPIASVIATPASAPAASCGAHRARHAGWASRRVVSSVPRTGGVALVEVVEPAHDLAQRQA